MPKDEFMEGADVSTYTYTQGYQHSKLIWVYPTTGSLNPHDTVMFKSFTYERARIVLLRITVILQVRAILSRKSFVCPDRVNRFSD